MVRKRFFAACSTLFTLLLFLYGSSSSQGANSPVSDHPIHVAGSFYFERSRDDFGVRCHGIIEKTTVEAKYYPLPQSTVDLYKEFRSQDLRYLLPHVLTAKEYQGREVLGPYQVEDHRVWFGNQFYDGEGERGVGAFGYFDMKSRTYTVFHLPEIARWEVTALLVDPDAVWLALDHFGEDISTSPGGLVRWDRHNHRIQRYPLEFVVEQIQRRPKNSPKLLLTAHHGYAVFASGEVQRFRLEKNSQGKETAVLVRRFPPEPSAY